jgi:ubiquinone/menaquinone biosynthesis C-methylase UbiE
MNQLAIWNAYMRSYDFLNKVDGYRRNLEDICDRVGNCTSAKILDAGSGTGNLSSMLKERGAVVTSCDFSRSALDKHRKKDPDATLIESSLEEPLPFSTGSFDAVCCASVLFSLTEKGCNLAVSEFYRVLRTKGEVIITIPAPDQKNNDLIRMYFKGLQQRHGRLGGTLLGIPQLPSLFQILRYGRKLSRLPDWSGWHRFTESELVYLLTRNGFSSVRVDRTYGNVFFLVTGLKSPRNI